MKTDHMLAAVASLICATAAFARERIPVTDWTLADHGSVYAEAVGRGWLAEDNDGDYLTGRALSRVDYAADDATRWHRAVVPGTVLTSLVADGTYPEPTYGENNRPEVIPESLCRTDWWYRATFVVPEAYRGRRVWLEFDGINYAAEIHVNGRFAGRLKGAFRRGRFKIGDYHLKNGERNALAVRISPQPTAGTPNEHTMAANGGPCGGVGRNDGPTFSCSLGWDWQSGVRDRNAGIWQGVWLSATRRIILTDPQIVTDLPDLPKLDRATITVRVPVRNTTHDEVFGKVVVSFDGVELSRDVKLGPWEDKTVEFTPETDPALVVKNPRLWWPNGLGEPALHKMSFVLEEDGKVSDSREETFGIRKFTYFVPEKKEFALSVNGVRVFMKGGNWGLDEMLKRIPAARIDAQVRMHRDCNFNMIRNWGGQNYSDQLADACDRYGILLFQEFWHMDAMGPRDEGTYFDNLRDTVLRYRNRASVVFWCALNEAIPHKMLNDRIRRTLAELDPVRHYQPHSGDFFGFNSGGPYEWLPPVKYTRYLEDPQFNRRETFKTELGAVAIPTYEAFETMFPAEDREGVTDAWGECNFAAGGGRSFIRYMTSRYGAPRTFADFVRKSQLMGYEAHRAMYEGRLARMFAPAEGVLLWMSIPSHPSLVWNLMSYDLEPHAAFYAVQQGCRPVHAFFTETDGGSVHLVNQTAESAGRKVSVAVYDVSGREISRKSYDVECPPASVRAVAKVEWPEDLPEVHFVRVDDAFYWRRRDTNPESVKDLGDANRLVYRENLKAMDAMPKVDLKASARTTAGGGRSATRVTISNPTDRIALLVHAQLVSDADGKRVLPAYWSENYVTLGPKEEKTLSCEYDEAALRGGKAKVRLDGWNVASVSGDASVVLNPHFAERELTGEEGRTFGFKKPAAEPRDVVRINCAGYNCGAFAKDPGFLDGAAGYQSNPVAMSDDPRFAPPDVYRTVRWSSSEYDCLMTGKSRPYLLRLHFSESSREKVAGVCKFDVKVNGKVVLPDFDVAAAAGGINRAVAVDVEVESDAQGHVRVEFAKGEKKGGERHRDPRVCGIEVLDSRLPSSPRTVRE